MKMDSFWSVQNSTNEDMIKAYSDLILFSGPPEKTAEFDRQVIAKAGDTVRLNCPVKSDPDPIFSWFKDDESIHQGWDRFRILTKGLRIKNIEVEDSGIYQCRATNGFGSVDVEYVVFVKGKFRILEMMSNCTPCSVCQRV